MSDILVLYYSQSGSVRELARHIARGVESVPGMSARVRTVPKVAPVTTTAAPPVPDEGAPYATARDLAECIAAVAHKLGFDAGPSELALTGGLSAVEVVRRPLVVAVRERLPECNPVLGEQPPEFYAGRGVRRSGRRLEMRPVIGETDRSNPDVSHRNDCYDKWQFRSCAKQCQVLIVRTRPFLSGVWEQLRRSARSIIQ